LYVRILEEMHGIFGEIHGRFEGRCDKYATRKASNWRKGSRGNA